MLRRRNEILLESTFIPRGKEDEVEGLAVAGCSFVEKLEDDLVVGLFDPENIR